MAEQGATGISWTDVTWNPLRGCSRISEGCRNCYAERRAFRFSGPGLAYEGLVQVNSAGVRRPQWNGQVRFVEKHLLDPLRWKQPRRVFVNSMSDLFHENVPDEWIDRIFAVMALAPQHQFQVLTKRPERMLKWFHDRRLLDLEPRTAWYVMQAIDDLLPERTAASVAAKERVLAGPLPNVWLGVSVEDQKAADARIPLLLKTPAAVRWISAEPLLGPLDLSEHLGCYHDDDVTGGRYVFEPHRDPYHSHTRQLDWVVGGGESGPGARPMHPDWARSLRDQCVAAGVAFHFKQWGGLTSHRAGRVLDGRTWDEYPAVPA